MADHCCQGKALGEDHDWSCPTQRPKHGPWKKTTMPVCGPNCEAPRVPVWQRTKASGKTEWRHFEGNPNRG